MSVSAKFSISVNGGAPQYGGIDVPSGASLQFTPDSTVGWLRVRWEIYDYPEGWATPTGWTLDATTGVVYSTAFTPPAVPLPANTLQWGKWAPRCMVNEQIDTDQSVYPDLLYASNAVCMLSPSGQRDTAALEEGQFCTPATLIKKWLRDYQRNLRVLEAFLGGASATPAQALAANDINWAAGNVFTKTLAAGANAMTFSNPTSGKTIIVRLTGNAGGSTVTWPAVKWAGGAAPTQTATGTDVYTFVHDGTNVYGSVVQAMA